jgi:uncharacterized small protein (DUF1192 family)
MRRLVIVATFLLLCAPALLPQVRINGIPSSVTSLTPANFGHARSFGGGHTFGHGHGSFGHRRGFGGFSHHRRGGFVHGHFGFGHHRFGVSFGRGFHHGRFFHRRFGRRHFFPGVVASYPVYAAPVYAYEPAYAYGAPAYAVASQEELEYYRGRDELAREVGRLREEVDRLREERAQRSQSAPQQTPRAEYKPPADLPATVLVFRNGKQEEVKNYAVVGQTLWVFSEQRARKVPLSDLDLAATRAVNEERGSDFHAGRDR